MAEPIDPLHLRVAELLGNEEITPIGATPVAVRMPETDGNFFDNILAKAIDAMEGVSRSEATANVLIDQYIRGEADLQEVMVATSKATVMVQMAVTTINLAVNTFKEITQMQV